MTSSERSDSIEAAGFQLYQLWFENPRVPMPHWKDLPEESREAICGIALRVIRRYHEVRGTPDGFTR